MDDRLQRQRRLVARKSRLIWALLALGAFYVLAIRLLPGMSDVLLVGETTVATAAGITGIVLGLYICSNPASNAIDLIFMERGSLGRLSSHWSGIGWLALNGAALILGWFVIVLGAIQLAGRAA